jgi:hypothetical protein
MAIPTVFESNDEEVSYSSEEEELTMKRHMEVTRMNTNYIHTYFRGSTTEPSFETKLKDKFDEQTEDIKEKVEDINDIFIDGVKLSTVALVSSHDSLEQKIEEQAEKTTSLKRKMNNMDKKLDEVLKLLSR